MKGWRIAPLAALGLAAVAGCGAPDSAPGEASEPASRALLVGATLEDTPWPSDAFLRGGRIDTGPLPLDGAAAETLAATLAELDGAPSYGSVFFPTTGGLPDGPLAGVARWVDLDDPASTFETALFHREATREVVALAPRDRVLAEGHRWACLVESPSLGPSPEMRAAMAGTGPLAAAYAGVAAHVRPGTSAATAFTVGHATRVVEAMIAVANEGDAPRASVARAYTGAALDALLGAPTTMRPGVGDPDGVVHDALGAVIVGTFDAPSFLAASPPAFGRVELDASGRPRAKGTAPIPFLLALPEKPASGWGALPVMIFQHGLNATRAQVAAVANDYARAGFATIGVDALWHGDRAANPRDVVHNFTAAPGGDGLADHDEFGATLALFDFAGDAAAGVAAFDGRYVRDNFRQAIVDLAVLVRLVREGDLSAVAASDPSLAGVRFDASRLVYSGESFGSILGAGALAATPGLDAGVLSVGGGGIFVSVLPHSPLFAGTIASFLRNAFDSSLDLADPALPPAAQRSLSLLQAAIAPGDPLSFAPQLAPRGKHMLLLTARSDELIPNQAGELFAAAAGATDVSLPEGTAPARFAELPRAVAPWRAEAGGSTIALVQLAPASHTMFTAFAGDRAYEPDFPPFVRLPAPEHVDNPIERAHALALGFATTFRRDGVPTVVVPDP